MWAMIGIKRAGTSLRLVQQPFPLQFAHHPGAVLAPMFLCHSAVLRQRYHVSAFVM